jgi:hypothetical protein
MTMREPALRALRAWLGDVHGPRLCVVTGSPGTGKSRLLAELRATDSASFDAMLSARGMTPAVVEWVIAGCLTLPPDGLLDRLAADTRPATILIGEFDESGPARDGAACAEIVATLLDPLLALGHVRLLVEGRPGAVDGFTAAATVLNLDAPAATDREAFAALLPDEAFPNIGTGLLGGATAAQWLNAQPEETLPGLYALGFAAAPADRATWLTLCTAITGDAASAEESVEATGPMVARVDGTYAMVSRALGEIARRQAAPGSAEAIAEALLGTVPRRADGRLDWAAASPYVLRHLTYHGVTSVLTDPGFLLTGDPVAITAAFADAGPEPLREAWMLAAPSLVTGAGPAERAALLRLAALRRRDEATAALFGDAQTAWEVVSVDVAAGTQAAYARDGRARTRPDPAGRLVTGPQGVAAIATADDGTALGRSDGTGEDGASLVAAVERHGAELTALGAGDGLLITGDRTGEVHAWPNAAVPASARLHDGPVTAVACVRVAPDSRTVVSGGADGAVRRWDVGHEPDATPAGRRDAPVSAVAAGTLSTGPAYAAAWADGLLTVWDVRSGRSYGLRFGYLLNSLAIGAGDTLVVGGRYGTATVRFRPYAAWPGLDARK